LATCVTFSTPPSVAEVDISTFLPKDVLTFKDEQVFIIFRN
jgi:hypothetical protein